MAQGRNARRPQGPRQAAGRLRRSGVGLLVVVSALLAVLAEPVLAEPAPASSAATVACSTEAAQALVEQLHLGNADDPNVANPVAQVLCGEFVGPGVESMVVSLTTPGCGRTIGWLVFRSTGESWELVLQRPNGAQLAAVGSDIQETMFVLRPGDAHCFPTGGTRARTWHWDGATFTHGAWRQVTPGVEQTTASFYSPSRNLSCELSDRAGKRKPGVYCQSMKHPHSVRMGLNGRLKICRDHSIETAHCLGDPGEGTPTLGYGKQVTVGRFRCRSQQAGVVCRVIRTGKGFFIDRHGVRRVEPRA